MGGRFKKIRICKNCKLHLNGAVAEAISSLEGKSRQCHCVYDACCTRPYAIENNKIRTCFMDTWDALVKLDHSLSGSCDCPECRSI